MAEAMFPADVLRETMHWGRFFGAEWIRDLPDKIHQPGIGIDGTPQRWHAEMARWMAGRTSDDDPNRYRTTRVMRRLRKVAPRSYEVLYRAIILGEDFEQIAGWLNERAMRNGIPLPEGRDVHYRVKDAVALFVCGVDYARVYW